MRIWMRRSNQGVATLQVTASTAERSNQAEPTPVVRLVAPGPSVDTQTPGASDKVPTVAAIKAAELSLAVSMN
jgi:hypothetical protein